jgi:polyphosphate kinase
VVEVPTDRLNRFVEIPRRKGKAGRFFIALDNAIRACLPQMFRGVIPIDSAQAYCFKFSRDAELELDIGIMESLIEKMESSLKQRRKADAVRFVYDAEMPQRLLDFLVSQVLPRQVRQPHSRGQLPQLEGLHGLSQRRARYLELKPLPVIRLPRVDAAENILSAIRDKDVLLYYPYHSFDYVIDLLKTAAMDPQVESISICLYRVAGSRGSSMRCSTRCTTASVAGGGGAGGAL